jgi:hypothetical protein
MTVDYAEETMAAISSLEQDAAKMDQVFDQTAGIRGKITNKLVGVIDKMEIDPDKDSPRDLETKIMVINAATGILNDTDSQQLKRVNVKAKLKELDTNNQHAEIVMEFLQQVDLSNPTNRPDFTQEDVDEEIEQNFDDTGVENKESELREDPTDYT